MPPKRGRGRGGWRGHKRGRGRGRGGQWHGKKADDTSKEEEELMEEMAPSGNEENESSDAAGKKANVEEEKGEESQSMSNMIFLKEADVGINEYLSTHQGFHGIIKQRYSDFIVNEIDQDGQIVKLTSLDVEDTGASADTEEEEDVQYEGVLTEEQTQKLTEMNTDANPNRILDISVPEVDKELRKKIHFHIRSKYKQLEADTIFEDEVAFIRVVPKGKAFRKGPAQFRRELMDWPKNLGKYCKFVMYKENMDTADSLFKLSSFFHLNKNMFQFAGTKDKRAITSQEITVYRVRAERLQKANRYFYKMALGNFRYVDQPLKLGQLKGNRFTIVLRNVDGPDDTINAALTSLQNIGFINYFGMQRFGTTNIPTHHIGRAILKNDYKEAAELILKPRPGEPPHVSECRTKWWETKNSLEMLSKIPRKLSIERSLLEGLIKYGENNFANAFQKVHRNTRLMYLHGYQSFIWNRIASRRIKQFGLKPIIGDLVYKGDLKDIAFKEDKEEEGDDESKNGVEEAQSTQERLMPNIVDANNIAQYDLHDVILPLPGFDVMYPQNEVETWYKEFLAEDGLEMSSLKHSNKQYALPGAYRRMVIKPGNVEWQVFMYDDVTKELTLSDLDLIHKRKPPESEPDGKLKALKIGLTLTASCYATMALREVMKIETSSAFQASLNSGPQADRPPTALAIKEHQQANKSQTSEPPQTVLQEETTS